MPTKLLALFLLWSSAFALAVDRCAPAFGELPPTHGPLTALGDNWRRTETFRDGDLVAMSVASESGGGIVRLYGTVRNVNLYGYPILELTDASGRVHSIDPAFIKSARKRISNADWSPRERDALREFEAMETARLEQKRLRELFCALKRDKAHPKDLETVQRLLQKNFLTSSEGWTYRINRCISSVFASSVLKATYEKTSRWPARENKQHTFMADHGSNLVSGLMYQSLFYCLSTGLQDPSQLAVVGTVMANFLGNIWEEVDLDLGFPQRSLPIFSSAGNQVHTDLPDFAMGAASSAIFGMGMLLANTQFGFRFFGGCGPN